MWGEGSGEPAKSLCFVALAKLFNLCAPSCFFIAVLGISVTTFIKSLVTSLEHYGKVVEPVNLPRVGRS